MLCLSIKCVRSYVFLLFRQPGDFNNQKLVGPNTPISHFDIRAFAEATNLGNPVAGTFILVGPDSCELICWL